MAVVRVRFAPSPTGFLHLGGLRTALFNYLFARKTNGVFVLRIEDTDQQRLVKGAAEQLEQTLQWAGVIPKEGPSSPGPYGPYVQSNRLQLYQEKVAEKLSAGTPYTVRLLVPHDEEKISFNDAVYGTIQFETRALDDHILIKSDGFPTYHFANVVDDHDMKISHVLRGEEWLSSTPKHIVLYRAFGWNAPIFAHLPLLLNKDRTKLSKRSGDLFVDSLRRDGMLPAAVTNFVALLGWTPKNTTKEVFGTLDEIAAEFDLADIHRAGAVVDMEKLSWFQRQHMRILSPEKSPDVVSDLTARIRKRYSVRTIDNSLFSTSYIGRVLETCKHTYDSLDALADAVGFFFVDDILDSAAVQAIQLLKDSKPAGALALLVGELAVLPQSEFTGERLKTAVDAAAAAVGWLDSANSSQFYLLVRLAVSGCKIGPSLPALIETIGQPRVMSRLASAVMLLHDPQQSQACRGPCSTGQACQSGTNQQCGTNAL